MNYIELKQIYELIKSGFDLESISFELGIPKEKLNNYINKYRSMNNTSNTIERKKLLSKINKLKKKYNNLFYADYSKKDENSLVLSDEENELINTTINNIENKITSMNSLEKTERRNIANSILLELKIIDDLTLNLSQSEKLYSLLHTTNMSNLSIKRSDKIDSYIKRKQKNTAKRFAYAIDATQIKTDDIDELKLLESKITKEMLQEDSILVSSVKSKIHSKIFTLTYQNRTNLIRNNISDNVRTLISSLADGTLSLENANQLIEDEISERQKNSSANNKLSSEKIKNQIFIQVKTLLKEQPTNYSIKNPNKTVEQLQQLTNIDITQSLQIVTTNLINEKSYEKAKILCDDFLKATRDDALKDTIYTMKKNIRNYEIGDMVLKGLSMDKSDDKQIEYFELIEKGLIKGNVKLSSIPLGTSKDGLKKIYLSDIMDINELER